MAAVDAALALAQGLALGFSLAGPPGPVNALIAREASRSGFAAGVRAGLPAPIVDSAFLGLVLLGLAQLTFLRQALPWLAGLGALLLAYLAWQTVRLRPTSGALAGPGAVWLVTLTNPFQYAWWISAGAAFMAATATWGIVGFLAAIFGWVFAFSALVAHGASRWAWLPPFLEVASADLLLLFALRLAWSAAAGL